MTVSSRAWHFLFVGRSRPLHRRLSVLSMMAVAVAVAVTLVAVCLTG